MVESDVLGSVQIHEDRNDPNCCQLVKYDMTSFCMCKLSWAELFFHDSDIWFCHRNFQKFTIELIDGADIVLNQNTISTALTFFLEILQNTHFNNRKVHKNI